MDMKQSLKNLINFFTVFGQQVQLLPEDPDKYVNKSQV
jgi:hypothetical protein